MKKLLSLIYLIDGLYSRRANMMMIFGTAFITCLLPSCAPQRITVYCEPQQAAIYIDGQYQGNGIINYSISRKQKYIIVSCTEDGVSFVNRRFFTKGIKSEISIYLDEYKTYSSDPNTLSTY